MKKQLFLLSFFLLLLLSIGGFGLYRSHKSQQVHNIFDEIYYDEDFKYSLSLFYLGQATAINNEHQKTTVLKVQ